MSDNNNNNRTNTEQNRKINGKWQGRARQDRTEQERAGESSDRTGQHTKHTRLAANPSIHQSLGHLRRDRQSEQGVAFLIILNFVFRICLCFSFYFAFALYFFPSLSIRLHTHTHTLQLAFTFCYFCRPHSIRPANLQWAAGYLKIAALAKDKLCLFLKPYER